MSLIGGCAIFCVGFTEKCGSMWTAVLRMSDRFCMCFRAACCGFICVSSLGISNPSINLKIIYGVQRDYLLCAAWPLYIILHKNKEKRNV